MPPEAKITAIHRPKDYAAIFTAAALGYAPHVALILMVLGTGGVARQAAAVAAMAVAVHIPYVRQIPMLVSRLFIRAFIVKGVQKPSRRLRAIFNEVTNAADIKGLKIYQYNRGVIRNAMAFGNEIYVGQGLVTSLNRRELKAVIAHEIAHCKTRDISAGIVQFLPYSTSIMLNIGAVSLCFQNVPGLSLTMAFSGVAMAGGYCAYQKLVRAFGTRVMEYRADRNALNFTRDPMAAAKAHIKISGMDAQNETGAQKNWFYKFKKLFRTHPDTEDRVRAILAHGQALKDAGLLPARYAKQDFSKLMMDGVDLLAAPAKTPAKKLDIG
ncbi:M48 family metallopeptidase [Micavibrio aeruginosavorus]|uniref:Peptidase M48, Ste24p n=1 Tax=Micavibrio aeruginosavorus EPB TaxID=349215 RepID=M4VDM5_9BACT|nr:M48 family metalloprotease [Micavibrio aeruginosavorus]AGH97462.1 peptidase M48, Ste24p [Micavibrio aeruginosavorus EPB]